MHEYYVAEQIVNITLKEAEAQKANKVNKVKVIIGELQAVIDESLTLYFELLTADTIAAGASLEIVPVRAVLFCSHCNLRFDKNYYFACPRCGKKGALTDTGRELYVEAIEVTC